MEEVLVPITIFGGLAVVLIVYFNNQHRERMAMIEKGLNLADAKGTPLREMFRLNPLSSLKWGLLALFIGVGFIVGIYLHNYYSVDESIFAALMFFFGGLALIIFYFFATKKMKQEENK
ncbi:MAG: DUF6249 domain-containing protein [bacterium]